jgi:hypothetical protein
MPVDPPILTGMRLWTPQARLVEVRYVDFLRANMAAALTLVSAYWIAEGYPVDLPVPAEDAYLMGNLPDDAPSLITLIRSYPTVTVEAAALRPAASEPLYNVDTLIVRVYVMSNNPGTANDYAHDYGTAVATILTNGKPPGVKEVGRPEIGIAPTIDITRASFLKVGMVTVPLLLGAIK